MTVRGCFSPLRFSIALVLGLFLALAGAAQGQPAIAYRLQYVAGDGYVHVSLRFSPAISAPAVFVIPRSYPGGYSVVPYDSFVEHVRSFSGIGNPGEGQKELDGPRWDVGQRGDSISRIEYDVDVSRMERELHSAIDTSKVRSRYLGILGYSVFGYVDGMQDQPIDLQVDAPHDWPIFVTLSHPPPDAGKASAHAGNYYELADSQVLMGPDLQVRTFPGKISLVMAVYAEGEEDVAVEGRLAREALDKVQAYFGTIPFQQYAVQLELLRPLTGHDYGFSQEHLDSGTFSFSLELAINKDSPDGLRQSKLFNYAHHMAHCWIPKRAYGVGYMPFTWEVPPVIDTIWFNEGFGRYAAIEALADSMPGAEGTAFRAAQLARLRAILADAPVFVQQMPLLVLSREASFVYESDFRIGRNIFARGALMAAEMDDRIREQTAGKKSLRDALRYVLQQCAISQRPFKSEELPGIFAAATGVDVHEVFERWLGPMPNAGSQSPPATR